MEEKRNQSVKRKKSGKVHFGYMEAHVHIKTCKGLYDQGLFFYDVALFS